MATWRQIASINYAESEELKEVIKLRNQNTKIRLDFQNLQRRQASREKQAEGLSQFAEQAKHREQELKRKITALAKLIRIEESSNLGIEQMLEKIAVKLRDIAQSQQSYEKKVVELTRAASEQNRNEKQHYEQLEAMRKLLSSKQIEIGRFQAQIFSLQNQIKLKTEQISKYETQLGEYSHKVSSLEIERRDFEIELQNLKMSSKEERAEEVKRECYGLLNSITVREDDYLRSYLMKNNRFQNADSVSRRNKYDFIFQQ